MIFHSSRPLGHHLLRDLLLLEQLLLLCLPLCVLGEYSQPLSNFKFTNYSKNLFHNYLMVKMVLSLSLQESLLMLAKKYHEILHN